MNVNGADAVNLTLSLGQLMTALAFIGAIGVAYWSGWRKARPFIKSMTYVLDDWNGTLERPGVPARPGVMERMAGHDSELREIRKILVPNGGASLADQVSRIEYNQDELRAAVRSLTDAVGRSVLVTPSAPVTLTVDPLGGLPGHPSSSAIQQYHPPGEGS